ncbi:MAG TPA: DNA-directed RNA polymerase subunit H [Candidatus Aminicenantes bacterium]|nr:DNA-directed RNA polymerase subunit H [Candidatus Aminicenantes bacterium]
MGKFQVRSHQLVPKHIKLSESEARKLLAKHNITLKELPKILKTDPLVKELGAKPGDIIKIIRKSEIAGEAVYYRGVI